MKYFVVIDGETNEMADIVLADSEQDAIRESLGNWRPDGLPEPMRAIDAHKAGKFFSDWIQQIMFPAEVENLKIVFSEAGLTFLAYSGNDEIAAWDNHDDLVEQITAYRNEYA